MPKIKSFKIFSIGKSIVIYVGIKLSYPLCIAAVWCMYESLQIPLPKIEFNAIWFTLNICCQHTSKILWILAITYPSTPSPIISLKLMKCSRCCARITYIEYKSSFYFNSTISFLCCVYQSIWAAGICTKISMSKVHHTLHNAKTTYSHWLVSLF